MRKLVILPARKDKHFHLNIGGRYMGMWSKKELEELILNIDNAIKE